MIRFTCWILSLCLAIGVGDALVRLGTKRWRFGQGCKHHPARNAGLDLKVGYYLTSGAISLAGLPLSLREQFKAFQQIALQNYRTI